MRKRKLRARDHHAAPSMNLRQYMTSEVEKDCMEQCLHLGKIKKGDTLFNKSLNVRDPIFRRSNQVSENLLTEGYFFAAMNLLSDIRQTKNIKVKDSLIYPALFCFRQYLELTIKDSIHSFRLKNGEIADDEHGFNSRKHNLHEFWDCLGKYITHDEETKNIGKMLLEFEGEKNSAESFRYLYWSEKRDRIKLPFEDNIDIKLLKKRMLQLYNFFEGISHLSKDGI